MVNKKNYFHLEFIRGISALLVVIGHLRSFLFINYNELESPSLFEKIFYFFTGFGHEAVMVFFVLSGFLISKSIDYSSNKNNFFSNYMLKRIVRLEIVLIPALLLTFFFDTIGIYLSDSIYYKGLLKEMYNSGLSNTDYSISYDFYTLIKNLFFLQTIYAPVYGTNSPLWSLAYEFWYYVFAGLFYSIYLSKSFLNRLLILIIISMLLLIMPIDILLYGLIWVTGVIVHIIEKKNIFSHIRGKNIFCLITIIFFILVLIISRLKIFTVFYMDLTISFFFSLLILSLLDRSVNNNFYIFISKKMSEISYTMYLIHFPIIGFIVSIFFENKQVVLEKGIVYFVSILALILVVSFIFFSLFEKHTLLVRKKIEQLGSFK